MKTIHFLGIAALTLLSFTAYPSTGPSTGPSAGPSKSQASAGGAPKAEAPKVEAPKVEAPKTDASAGGPSTSGLSERMKVLADFIKLRDPFKKVVVERLSAKPKSELEEFAVSEYKLLGVLTGPRNVRAMLLAPNGKTYIVSEKTPIGLNKGIISKITANGITVRERFTNALGEEELATAKIKLPAEAQDDQSASAPREYDQSGPAGQGNPPEQDVPQDAFPPGIPGQPSSPQQVPGKTVDPTQMMLNMLGNLMKPGGK